MKKFYLEIVVFICGAVVMVYEIVGSRVVGPFLGNSIFIWTSLIGIILGALSLGYYLGGRLSDRRPSYRILGWIIVAASAFILLTNWGKDIFLSLLPRIVPGLKMQSVVSALVLFAPASIFLGMVSPYAVKLKIKNLATSGSTVGNLYAISTIGSIVGTFGAGFFFIPLMGTNQVLYFLSGLLALIGLSTILFSGIKDLLVPVLILLPVIIYSSVSYQFKDKGYVDVDSKYSRILIYDENDPATGQMARYMRINKNHSSGMFTDTEYPVFRYAYFYLSAGHFCPGFKNALMLGGAAYTFPMFFLEQFPNATMDVIEIDPMLTKLAKTYFNLRDDPRLHIFHEDGRIFLNETTKKYDVFYGDAYNSLYTIPWHLTTIETVREIYHLLNDGGVAMVNIISSISGHGSEFLRAELATFREVFPQVYAFALHDPDDEHRLQSIILVALKSNEKPSFTSNHPSYGEFLENEVSDKIVTDLPVLTDQYAPVEFYTNKAI